MIESISTYLKQKLSRTQNTQPSLRKLPPVSLDSPVVKRLTQYFTQTPLDFMSDQEIEMINQSLRWNAFTIDAKGRPVGNAHSLKKRASPQIIPDSRILKVNEAHPLQDKTILEVGCFEGIHSIGLSKFAKKITAIDSRVENIIKANTRSFLYGVQNVEFKVFNMEEQSVKDLGSFDFVFHCGVLYHMYDPFQHLQQIGSVCKDSLFLDTHVMNNEIESSDNQGKTISDYKYSGKTYEVLSVQESGYRDVFSGMQSFSRWVKEDDLLQFLKNNLNFSSVEILERRPERSGLRLAILAKR